MERRMKKLILAGIGAAALAREESSGLLRELVEKGENVVEHSGIQNEVLRHDSAAAAQPMDNADVDAWLNSLCKMTPAQLHVLRDAIDSVAWAQDHVDYDTDDNEED